MTQELSTWKDLDLTCRKLKSQVIGEWNLANETGNVFLEEGQTFYMSDAYGEYLTQKEGFEQCEKRGGKVLTTGLGVGMFVDIVLGFKNVESITVIEKNQEVIDFISKPLKERWGKRLIIVKADALEYVPDQHYSVIWHDIWPLPNRAENLRDRKVMEPQYAPYCDWQGFWETHGNN